MAVNTQRILRGLVISALLSALVYAALAIVSDARAVGSALATFPISTLAAMVGLTLTCYLIRSVRWRYLVGLVGFPLSAMDAAYVQTAGMTMTVTPGKVGEVLKGVLAREISGMPVARGVALVFAERLADVVAVTALSAGALGVFADTGPALAVVAAAVIAGIAALSSHRVHELALRVAMRQRWMRQHHESAALVSETVRAALSVRTLVVSVLLSAVAWGCEGVAFALCLRALGFMGLSLPASIAVYAISTLVGAFTFLPGGIGLTEASLAGLLVAVGMQAGGASAATLVIRLVTLWFGVALGWLVLASRPRMLRMLTSGGLLGSEPSA